MHVSMVIFLACNAAEARTASHVSQSNVLRTELRRETPQETTKDEKKPDDSKQPPTADKTEEKKGPVKAVKRTLENTINVMRGELCWGRHSMIGHKDCMDWLVEECTTKTFGTGLCKRVIAHVKEECFDKKNAEACEYARRLGMDVPVDTDGDGVFDKDDAFPKDPKETKDTDGDGVGDNADEAPQDPKCTKKPCEAPTTPAPAAPAPAPAKAAPAPAQLKEDKAAPAPAKAEPKAAPAAAKEEPKAPAPAKKEESKPGPEGSYKDPVAEDGLASQGFSGKKVTHADGDTATADWGKEYGHDIGKEAKKSSTTRAWNMHAMVCLVAAALAFTEKDLLLGF